MEAVSVRRGNAAFLLVRISGELSDGATVDPLDGIEHGGLPVAVTVHTYGGGGVTLEGEWFLCDGASFGNGAQCTEMKCYSNSSMLTISSVSTDSCYGKYKLKYENHMWERVD